MDLGERSYRKGFSFDVLHQNDGNGHLNNCYYPVYSELARQSFLKEFGWSDEQFREDGFGMYLWERDTKHRKPINRGDRLRITMEIYLNRGPIFYIVYTFKRHREEVCIDRTKFVFVDVSSGKHVSVPNFFINALKRKG